MTGAEIAGLVVAALLVVFAAVLAVAETSLTHLSLSRARALDEEERKHAATLVRLLEQREATLNPVLFLQLTCYLVAATVLGAVADSYLGLGGLVLVMIVALFVVYIVAVAIPKTWALQHTDRAALTTAPLVRALVRFPPLRWLTRGLIGVANVILPGKGRREGPSISEEELLAFAEAAVSSDAIDADEQALIESIIEFGDTIVREVMVPRPDMVTIDSQFRVADAMEVCLLNGYSRIPVSGEGIDDIVGLIIAKDLMRAERDGHSSEPVGDYYRKLYFVPETKPVADLLPEMQSNQQHLAIVVDEYGGTAGLVTLEDLIEELVGEIVDEFDHEEAMIEPMPDGEVRVNARMPVDEVNEILQTELPEGDWDTVGGLMFHLLGHVPVEGESTESDDCRLHAERVQGRRIGRVRISRERVAE